jgi:Domain of unknown function (DUF222)
MFDIIGSVAEPDDLALQLICNQHQIDRLLLEQSRLAAEFVQTGLAGDEGYASPHDWIRINCHLTSDAVSARVRVGERMGELSESVEAVDRGEIGFAHLATMAKTAEAVGDRFDQAALLAVARESSAGKFHYRCLQYRHSVDPKRYAGDEFEKYEQRGLTMSRWEDGSLILTGVLGPAEGAAFRSVIEPLAKPCGAHDNRSRKQRLADALYESVTHGGRHSVAMQVTASIETLLGLIGAPGAENEFSLPISSETVKRWACDCSLTRVLMKDSVVIDVGRSERTIKGQRRKALIARDQHCQWPGCDRPASWCDGHHIVHWTLGGSGEIENQILLCHRHHVLVHEGNWQIVRTDEGRVMVIQPGVTFARARAPDLAA